MTEIAALAGHQLETLSRALAAVSIGHLHRRGLVHQDVKPENVLLDILTGRAGPSGLSIASIVSRERKGSQPADAEP